MRSCDGCTKCCDGWLPSEVNGKKFYKGMPCFYVKTNHSCTIYKNRPNDPCRSFSCEWLVNEKIPDWMKPDLVNVVIKKVKERNIEFFNVIECGKKIDASVLNWIFLNLVIKGHNVLYEVDGGKNYMGSTEFVALMDANKHT